MLTQRTTHLVLLDVVLLPVLLRSLPGHVRLILLGVQRNALRSSGRPELVLRLEKLERLHLAAGRGGLGALCGRCGRVRQLLLHLVRVLLVSILDLRLLLGILLGIQALVELLKDGHRHLNLLAVAARGGCLGRRCRRHALLTLLLRLLVVIVVHLGPPGLQIIHLRLPLLGVGAVSTLAIGAAESNLVLSLEQPQILLAAVGGGGGSCALSGGSLAAAGR